MKLGWQPGQWLKKKARAGFRGYPVATIAFYGPDTQRASKVAVGIIMAPDSEPAELRRWFVESGDVRNATTTCAKIAAFLRGHDVRLVSMVDAIIGSPHEEGIDYSVGEACPHCPFWSGRARWADGQYSR